MLATTKIIFEAPSSQMGPFQGWKDLQGMHNKADKLVRAVKKLSMENISAKAESTELLESIYGFQTRIRHVFNVLTKTPTQQIDIREINWREVEQQGLLPPKRIIARDERYFHTLCKKVDGLIGKYGYAKKIPVPFYARETLDSFTQHWGVLKQLLRNNEKQFLSKPLASDSIWYEIAGTVVRLLNDPDISSITGGFLSGNITERRVLREILNSLDKKKPIDIKVAQAYMLLEAIRLLNIDQKFPGIGENGSLEAGVGLMITSSTYPTLIFKSLKKVQGSLYEGVAQYANKNTGEIRTQKFKIRLSSLYTLKAVDIWDDSGRPISNFFANSFRLVDIPKEDSIEEPTKENNGTWWNRIKQLFSKGQESN